MARSMPRKTPRAAAAPGSPWRIRRARPGDLAALRDLEAACFQPYRRASPSSLRRSLSSRMQSVWVVDRPGTAASAASRSRSPGHSPRRLAALLVLWHFPHRVRVYDVATHPDLQGQGLGHALMAHAERLAREAGADWLTLEADPKEAGLVAWYRRQGFGEVARLPGYYRNGNAALRMVKRL